MKDRIILTAEDGRQFALTDKEFEEFELIFGERELVEVSETSSGAKLIKTPVPREDKQDVEGFEFTLVMNDVDAGPERYIINAKSNECSPQSIRSAILFADRIILDTMGCCGSTVDKELAKNIAERYITSTKVVQKAARLANDEGHNVEPILEIAEDLLNHDVSFTVFKEVPELEVWIDC